MNAIELLKEDHRKVSQLFAMIEQSETEAQKRQLFDQIDNELSMHAWVEENIFYPACARFDELADAIEHSFDEHAEVKDLLSEIEDEMGSAEADGAIAELIENVLHHVAEEEQELFPQAEKLMTAQQLSDLGQMIQDAKSNESKAA